MERDIHAAAICHLAEPGQAEANWARALKQIEKARGQGAEFILLPEAGLTGYTLSRPFERAALPLEGPLLFQVGQTARRLGLTIAAGLIEAWRGRAFLSQAIFTPAGLAGVYRKTILSPAEARVFTPGDRPGLFELPGLTAGLMLCYEAHFPEIGRHLTERGASLLLAPSASPRERPEEKMERWLRYLPARAYDNSAYLLAANQAGVNAEGLEFAGVALALDPKGRVLASRAAAGDGFILARLEAAPLLAVRRHPLAHFRARARRSIYP